MAGSSIKPMLRDGSTHRTCTKCNVRRQLGSFEKAGKARVCKQCNLAAKQRRRLRAMFNKLQVVEVTSGDDCLHIMLPNARRTHCRRTGVHPLKYGNGPEMLKAFVRDEATCAKCRERLVEVLDALNGVAASGAG